MDGFPTIHQVMEGLGWWFAISIAAAVGWVLLRRWAGE